MRTIHNVLITGGSGFVGGCMVRTRPDGVNVSLLDSAMYRDMEWDYLPWDAIVHLAPVHPDRVIDCAQKRDIPILYASSGAIYGNRYDEYVSNKRAGEYHCKYSGVDTVIARLFSFVGEGLKRHSVYDLILGARRGEIQVWGDGSTVRSYLYGDDLGRWMWKLLLEGTETYDVGSETPYTILEVAQIVQSFIPCKIKFVEHPTSTLYYVPNTQRAKELGCTETVDLRSAIERIINA